MEASKEQIDYEELEGELNKALKEDELYRLQNEAKFRAVEQAVPTYEHFRQMVNAAHLKPLEPKDKIPKIGVKWNNSMSSHPSTKQKFQPICDPSSVEEIFPTAIPTSSHNFRKLWKQFEDYHARFKLLKESRFAMCDQIFRSEIPPDIFNESIATCLESLDSAENVESVIEILFTFTDCRRFKLALEFMSTEDKSVLNELFRTLRQAVDSKNGKIDELEKQYCS